MSIFTHRNVSIYVKNTTISLIHFLIVTHHTDMKVY